jgi:hypothetical protein
MVPIERLGLEEGGGRDTLVPSLSLEPVIAFIAHTVYKVLPQALSVMASELI